MDYIFLVRFRGTDVGEASEPEGFSSRSLPNDVTRALIEYFLFLFIDNTFREGEVPLFGAIWYNAGGIRLHYLPNERAQDIWFLLLISAIKAHLRLVGDTTGLRIAKKSGI